MASKKDENKDPIPPGPEEKVEVPSSFIVEMQEKMAKMEQEIEDGKAKQAGMEELLSAKASTEGETKLRTKRSYEPAFHTVGIRKFPIAGDDTNLGYIIGWTSRGAYQEVDRSGITPQFVDFIDVIFLGHEKTEDGKIKAEKIKLLDFYAKGIKVNCKIVGVDRKEVAIPTGEEIDVTTFDPAHGLVATGEKIDGFVTQSEITYKIQIPGVAEIVEIDQLYVN